MEELKKLFPEALEDNGERAKYLTGEKCYIYTKQSEKVMKKGTRIDHHLRKKFEEYLEDLEKRGVIRQSSSI